MVEIFNCKEFNVKQDDNTMKVNTDAILLGAWVGLENTNYALDIGTGTGIISLILAQRSSKLFVTGIEIDQKAAQEADFNFKNSKWSKKLNVVHSPVQDYSDTCNIGYDLIVSNPPFFSGGTFSKNENKNNVRHAIKLSHGDLLLSSKKLLKFGGRLAVILPYIEGERFLEMAMRVGFSTYKVTEVHSKAHLPVERLLIEMVNAYQHRKISRKKLTILEEGHDRKYNREFKLLTSDYYTIF